MVCKAMTLEAILWAIPTASLTAASVLIAHRAWRLSRESALADAFLARALELEAPSPPAAEIAEIPIEASAPPAPLPANRRLCPVPIIVCGTSRHEPALAG